ncbi:MAG: helix-turn-helix transcriptional regulator [Sulfuricaulis sp.]|nr:helix-turn-helix transcriptional regulator [Sulfuricaulis sp.]
MTALAQPDRAGLDRRCFVVEGDYEGRRLCAILSRRREALRLTRTQLAAQIGTSREMLRHWETGKGNPTTRYLILWARALDMAVVLR